MNILMINPAVPDTFWSFKHALKFIRKKAVLPPLGLLTGKVDFSEKFLMLSRPENAPEHFATVAEAQKAGATVLAYGQFLNTIIQFMIVAFAIFILIKQINRLKREEEAAPAAPPAPPRQEVLLEEIRNLLAKKA